MIYGELAAPKALSQIVKYDSKRYAGNTSHMKYE